MRITLDISEKHVEEFKELIKGLDYISIEETNEEIPVWQQEEVAERLESLRLGKIKTRNWEEAKKDIFG